MHPSHVWKFMRHEAAYRCSACWICTCHYLVESKHMCEFEEKEF